jgi:hypothetical protein
LNQQCLDKTCPYCKFPIKNLFNVKVCPLCDMPHHIECWQENCGCTTLGCKCQSSSGQLVENQRIVIGLEDLVDEEDEVRGYYGSNDNHKYRGNYKPNPLWNNPVIQLVLAGFIGGVVTWFLALLIFDFGYYADIVNYEQVLIEIAFFASLLGGVIGAVLGSLEGLTGKVSTKLIYGLIVGLIVGAVGGFIGAIVGQIFYSSLDTPDMHIIARYILRGVFWGLVGMFIGISQGIGSGGGKRLSNGIAGGLIGGFVSGFLFDYLFLIFSSAPLSGFLALSIFGICTGSAIGTVQGIRKEAWLKVLEGETAGKEYIIYNEITTIGSAPQCDIVLINDFSVAKKHAEIISLNNAYSIKIFQNSGSVRVGHRNVSNYQLKNSDIITIGKYKMQYFEKVKK